MPLSFDKQQQRWDYREVDYALHFIDSSGQMTIHYGQLSIRQLIRACQTLLSDFFKFDATPMNFFTLSVDNTSSVFSLGLVVIEYRGLRSGSMTVSPLSQRMMMGHSPLAVQFSSFKWPFLAMVVLGWLVIIAGTGKGREMEGEKERKVKKKNRNTDVKHMMGHLWETGKWASKSRSNRI